MLLQIAWRNIWRSKTRSFVVIGAVLLGVWSFIALMSFTFAIVSSYISNAVENQTSHIQIHNPDFPEDKEIQYTLSNKDTIRAILSDNEGIKQFTERTLVSGMIRSSRGARGVMIRGTQAESERKITNLDTKLTSGKYFEADRKNQILVSEKIAEKLQLKLRKKLVLQFQDFNGEISQGSFRVAGIYKTGNTPFDLGMVVVQQKDINRLIGKTNVAHEIAIQINDTDNLIPIQNELKAKLPNLLIENYKEISPDIALYESQIGISSAIFLTIFMLALIFGIINTMLMAVLERSKEIGMLMAIGMNKRKIFGMIITETLLLGLIGAPLGMLIGWLSVNYFNKNGIDLSNFADGFEQFGMSTIIRPELSMEIYLQLVFAVFITALLASIYPALKAVRLKPLDAMHKL